MTAEQGPTCSLEPAPPPLDPATSGRLRSQAVPRPSAHQGRLLQDYHLWGSGDEMRFPFTERPQTHTPGARPGGAASGPDAQSPPAVALPRSLAKCKAGLWL